MYGGDSNGYEQREQTELLGERLQIWQTMCLFAQTILGRLLIGE